MESRSRALPDCPGNKRRREREKRKRRPRSVSLSFARARLSAPDRLAPRPLDHRLFSSWISSRTVIFDDTWPAGFVRDLAVSSCGRFCAHEGVRFSPFCFLVFITLLIYTAHARNRARPPPRPEPPPVGRFGNRRRRSIESGRFRAIRDSIRFDSRRERSRGQSRVSCASCGFV